MMCKPCRDAADQKKTKHACVGAHQCTCQHRVKVVKQK